ncbi:MAG: 30S ribosomal protein S6 [Dehalococcoidia bacterium]|nr:30S ribosomal protein S6 [Dehalococcoidia bacterium]RLC63356.1 MAG: 30S ribosomal protein S6 [Chloroflexota bacterium]
MRDYELVAIINPELDEERISKIVDRVSQSINSRGGSVEEIKKWGRRKLAYPIKKFMEADYVLARFQLMPQSVKELETEISASEDILRYLVIKTSD